MKNKRLRLLIVAIVIFGIALLAKGQVAWAGPNSDTVSVAVESQGDASASLGVEPGSVKPPSPKFSTCKNGVYSVGGVVVMTIKDLRPSYCVEAELGNQYYPVHAIQEDAGDPVAHFLIVRIYRSSKLQDELSFADGSIEGCYAVPPEKQVQFYFYDYYWRQFGVRTEAPLVWDLVNTRIDDAYKVTCAFTQFSGVYGLLGK